jgi:hypothetical protein
VGFQQFVFEAVTSVKKKLKKHKGAWTYEAMFFRHQVICLISEIVEYILIKFYIGRSNVKVVRLL